MSIKAMSKVWQASRQKGSELLLLLAIADFTDDEGGEAWPSISTLAAKIRMSQRNVFKLLEKLRKSGELEIQSRAGKKGSNIYQIRFPDPELPFTPEKISPLNSGTQNGEPAFRSPLNPSSPEPLRTVRTVPEKATPNKGGSLSQGDAAGFWERAKDILRDQLSPEVFAAGIDTLEPVGPEGGFYVLNGRTRFLASQAVPLADDILAALRAAGVTTDGVVIKFGGEAVTKTTAGNDDDPLDIPAFLRRTDETPAGEMEPA